MKTAVYRLTNRSGIDPYTGKKLRELTGFYNEIGIENGKIVLREVAEQAMRLFYSETPFRGYRFQLVVLDPKTGTIVKREKHGLTEEARLSVDWRGYLTKKFAYGVEGELSFSTTDATLTRYTRDSTSPQSIKSYAEYGNLVSGLVQGWFFFQKDGVLTALRASDNKTVSFGRLHRTAKILNVQTENQYVFVELNVDGANSYVLNLETGETIGKFEASLDFFTTPFFLIRFFNFIPEKSSCRDLSLVVYWKNNQFKTKQRIIYIIRCFLLLFEKHL